MTTLQEHLTTLPANPLADAHTQLRSAVTKLGYDDRVFDMLAVSRREVAVSIPSAATTAPSRCCAASGSNTTSPADPPKADCATAPTSPSTKSAPWQCG